MSLDTNAPTQRLQWLDAMRGFTMILVVVCHVMIISFDINYKTSFCQKFFVLFRMPLFFFVSGFLAYRAKNIWTGSFFFSQLRKKVKVQIIPALIFFLLYVSVFYYKDFYNTIIIFLNGPTKGGYWFTWVLLQMFCIYYLLEYVCDRSKHFKYLHLNINIILGVAWVLSVMGYAVLYMPPIMRQMLGETKNFLDASSLIKTIEFFQFFLLGNLVHRHWNTILHIINSKCFYPVLILVATMTTSEFLFWHNLRFMWTNIPRTLAIYSLLIVLVCFFMNYERWFTKDTYVGHSLQYIGTRTLDVYLLHYFFLPKMPAMGRWLNNAGNSFILDLTCGMAVSLLVIAFSLIASNILRISPFLSELLFGRKVNKLSE